MQIRPNASSVAIYSGDNVLLVQRAYPPYQGYWTLPGGRARQGESPEVCARREIGEELGLTLTSLTPVTIVTFSSPSPFNLSVFATRLTERTPHPSDEILDWRWVLQEEISTLSTTPDLTSVLQKANLVLTTV